MIKKFKYVLTNDSLYRNSVFLLLNNIVIAGIGFIFWAITTRLFTPEEIGIATTLLSSVELVALIALLGLNVSLVRFLQTSENKNKLINSSLTVAFVTSIVITVIYIFGISNLSPKLVFLYENKWYILVFLVFVILLNFGELIKSIFRSYLNSQYVLIQNTIHNISKIILVFTFTGQGAFGLLAAWMLGLALALIYSFIVLIRKFDFKPKIEIQLVAIRKMWKFSISNYLIEFFERTPKLAFPLIITPFLGPEKTAHYYIAMSLATFIFLIPEAISSSYYAEDSADETTLTTNTKKVLKAYFVTILPISLGVMLFGNYILLFYGKEYSVDGFRLLQLLSISGIPVAINAMCNIIMKVKLQLKALITINIIGAVSTLVLSALLIPNSLLGVGWAWFAGQLFMNVLYLIWIYRLRIFR